MPHTNMKMMHKSISHSPFLNQILTITITTITNFPQKLIPFKSYSSSSSSSSTTTTTTTTISFSSSSSSSSTSPDLLQKLNHKDWLAPNQVLKIFQTLKDPDSILKVFETISQRKDYTPNEPLYILIIQKLSQSKKFDAIQDLLNQIKIQNNPNSKLKLSDEFFYFLLKIYGNVAGNIDLAIKTLLDMPKVYNCWPSVKTFNYVLNLLISSKQFEIVHEVYLEAPRLGIALDSCSLNIMIKGLCENAKLKEAFEILEEFPKQGCKPNAKTYSTLMNCLCKKGRVDEAIELLNRMEEEGCEPDTITFNILISGLRKQGRIDGGMKVLDWMRIKGCNPNSGSYQEVLYGILEAKKFVEAKCLIDRMISQGMFPSFLSYKLVIDGLCDENLLDDLDLVLKQMIVNQGFVPKMGTWKRIVESLFKGRRNSCSSIDICQVICN